MIPPSPPTLPPKTHKKKQVESVKVWQTNEDYFLEPRAAATAGLTASNGGSGSPFSSAEGRDIGGALAPGTSPGGHVSSVLLYVTCCLVGGVLGGVAVGWWLGRASTRKGSRVYESINGSGTTTPAL